MANLAYTLFRVGGAGPNTATALAANGTWDPTDTLYVAGSETPLLPPNGSTIAADLTSETVAADTL